MQEALRPGFGFVLEIDKGIPLGSGLGGSAASAVAAVVAANALLPTAVRAARAAEVRHGRAKRWRAARGMRTTSRPRCTADWCSPSASIIRASSRSRCRRHTRGDRASAHVPRDRQGTCDPQACSVELSDFVWQTANLAGFISGCYTNDLDMIRASFEDVVIEPQRAGADSGLSRGAPRGHAGRRARLLDLRGRTVAVRLDARVDGGGGTRGHAARVRAALARNRCTGWSSSRSPGARLIA